ncbi:MAG: NAD(P)/FAD-dependent oxidoreductase [Verrucomicrobia bacterium]|nr:NAD(P)/FAD-dependent oxidoreductase [Verrucomicrobiota bacterium]
MQFTFDVAVIGGAIAGASAAFLLKHQHPDLRVLIIEKSTEFDRKVGESTSEVSASFLSRVLNLAQHLGHEQLTKSGLRFWFCQQPVDAFNRCTELGPLYQTRLPTFQLDRAKLDQVILEKATAAGCELWRPAKIKDLTLGGADRNQITVRVGEEIRTVTARWVIDGTGRASVIARKLKLFRPLESHPTNAVWARFKGVTDLDGLQLWDESPDFTHPCRVMRQWATNHLMGYGWWVWIIPLRGGDFSVGIVYDSRLYELPPGPSLADRLKAHLLTHPLGRKLFADAQHIENDVRAYSQLPFYSEQTMGDGWILVGDAAGFLDPLYSPGLDMVAFTVSAAVDLVTEALSGRDVSARRDAYNRSYQEQFRTWFEGVYKDKYYYMGDAELMTIAFLFDVGCYFMGPVRQVYRRCPKRYTIFPYTGPIGSTVGRFMRFYNRRLAVIAKRRRAAGVYGPANLDRRLLLPGFSPDHTSFKFIRLGLRKWLRAEWQHLFTRLPEKTGSRPVKRDDNQLSQRATAASETVR